MPNRSDAHYTPPWVADRVAAEVVKMTHGSAPHVADYTAGDGALLRAVARRLPTADITATDIDQKAVTLLKAAHPTWNIGVCDVLNARSRGSSLLLGVRGRRADAIVLNPPFSYRGGTFFSVLGGEHRASPALAFVVHALGQLRDGGSAVVLVPSGALTSQKDEALWGRLRQSATIRVLDEFDRTTFRGEFATASLVAIADVSLGDLKEKSLRLPIASTPLSATRRASTNLRLVRGSQQMHTVSRSITGSQLVHSTHLQDGRLVQGPSVVAGRSTISGPVVLLPRVGAPRRDKVVLHSGHTELVLSDCVLALSGTVQMTRRAHSVLLDRWEDVANLYLGSCAPYITVRRLRVLVEKLGFTVEVSGRGG